MLFRGRKQAPEKGENARLITRAEKPEDRKFDADGKYVGWKDDTAKPRQEKPQTAEQREKTEVHAASETLFTRYASHEFTVERTYKFRRTSEV